MALKKKTKYYLTPYREYSSAIFRIGCLGGSDSKNILPPIVSTSVPVFVSDTQSIMPSNRRYRCGDISGEKFKRQKRLTYKM
jgi:hypothetical protein